MVKVIFIASPMKYGSNILQHHVGWSMFLNVMQQTSNANMKTAWIKQCYLWSTTTTYFKYQIIVNINMVALPYALYTKVRMVYIRFYPSYLTHVFDTNHHSLCSLMNIMRRLGWHLQVIFAACWVCSSSCSLCLQSKCRKTSCPQLANGSYRSTYQDQNPIRGLVACTMTEVLDCFLLKRHDPT